MREARPPTLKAMKRVTGVAWPALAVIAAVGVTASLVLAAGGSAVPAARAVSRVVLELAAGVVLGALVTVRLRPDLAGYRDRLLDAAAVAAGTWTLAAGTIGFLLYLGQAPSIAEPTFGPGLVAFVSDIPVGRTWLIATVAAAVLTALLLGIRSRAGVAALAPLAVLALLPVALQASPPEASLAGQRTAVTAELVRLVVVSAGFGAAAASLVLDRTEGGRASLQRGPARRRVQRLLPVPLVLLAVASGLAAARAVNRAAPEVAARTTPAEILTGAPLPSPVSAARLLTGWQPDAVWLVVCAILLAVYGWRAARIGARWPLPRTLSWAAGVGLLAWLTSGGPAVYQQVLVSVFLTQHAALVLLVPLLLAGGRPQLLLRGGSDARDPAATGAPPPPLVRILTRPVPAATLAVIAVAALVGTGLLRWSVTDVVGTEWGLLQCLLAGALLVGALSARSPRRRTVVTTAVALLVVESAAALAGVLGSGLLLADWYGAMGWGTDALQDQRAGAALAWPVLAAPTLVLLVAALRRTSDPRPAAVGA